MSEEKKTEEYERVFILWILNSKEGLIQSFIKIPETNEFYYGMDPNKLVALLATEFYEHNTGEHLLDIFEVEYEGEE